MTELSRFVHASLLDPAVETPATRHENVPRRIVACALVLVVGAACLGWSLRLRPGDSMFYAATAILAAVWLIGARLSGPVAPGHARTRHGDHQAYGLVQGLVWGSALLAVFLLGALVVSHIPPLSQPVQALLDHARRGSLPLVTVLTAVNGLAEEYFFRGALFQAITGRRRIVITTLLYAAVTALSGIPLLVFAAVLLGFLTALQRRATGGFLAPTVTHLTWSLGMLFLLPLVMAVGH